MKYTYNGNTYSYEPWDDIEPEENCKTFHDVYLIERDVMGEFCGKKSMPGMPMSPYERVTEEVFEMWIKSGMPTKKDMGLTGNARNKDIKSYYWKVVNDKIDKMLLMEDTDEVSG